MISRNRDIEEQQVAEGLTRKILSYADKDAAPGMMAAEMCFLKGAVGAAHSHPHEQIGYVVSGTFELTMGGKTSVLDSGDTYYVAPDVPHGVVALTDGVLLDVFAPMRKDFL